MLVWNDIAKYTNDYKNGIKKLDDMVNDSDKTLNNKLNYKKNKFKVKKNRYQICFHYQRSFFSYT